MSNLSVILNGDEKEIYNHIKDIESILDICDYQLIIISNTLKSIATKYEYVIYNYTESYNNFKDFCLSLCKYDKVLIVEKGIEINKSVIDNIKTYIKEESDANLKCNFNVYIDKGKFFLQENVLIYNTISNKSKQLNTKLNDYSLLFEYDEDIEASVYKLINYKRYKELYEWSQIFADDIKTKIYQYIEKQKLHLYLEEVNSIEEEFLKHDSDKKYNKYLKIKGLYKNYNEALKSSIINGIKEGEFFSKDLYFSSFLLEAFSKDILTMDVLSLLDADSRTSYLKYLFELDEKFYLKIYNFIINIDLIKELDKPCNKNIEIYFDIIKTYITCMSDKSEKVDKKEKLIQMFTDYTNCGFYLLQKDLIKGEEAEFLTEIGKAASKLSDDINEAIKILKCASEKFDLMPLSIKYYIQKLIYENNLYTRKLSICMIVKNEESNIERCLKSLWPLVDKKLAEIILVDTGSTDNTVEIAQKYLEKVYFHPWSGSFSEARNWSLSLATGEYIFIVDGDDEIKEEDINKIVKEFSGSDYKRFNTFSLKVKSYFTEKLDDYSTMTQNHIFKNDGSFYYSGTVHNQPIWKEPIKHLNISIMHYGYIMTPEISEKKYNRTVPLLKKELERNFNDIYKCIYYRYQLASSYNMHQDYKDALEEVEVYLKIIKDNWNTIKHNYNITYNALAVMVYINNELYDEALDICNKSLKMIPEYIDFIYFKSKILFIKKKYKESIEYMEKYLGVLDRFDSLNIAQDDKYVFYTVSFNKEVYLKMINAYYQLDNYKACIEYINKIDDDKILAKIIYIVFECYFKEKEYKKLVKLYEMETISENSHIFNYYIRNNLSNLSKEEQKEFIDTIVDLGINTKCVDILNESILDTIKGDTEKILNIINKYDIENIDASGAKIILEVILPIVRSYNDSKYYEVIELKDIKRFIRFILNRTLNLKQFSIFTEKELLGFLYKYIDICSNLVKLKTEEALEEKEYKFFNLIMNALKEIKKGNMVLAIRYIRDAVCEDNEMARPMELFIQEITKDSEMSVEAKERENTEMNNEMEKYSKEVKKNIEKLINSKSVDDALKLVDEYMKIISNDVEVYSMKAVIFIMQNKLVAAKEVLEVGLNLDKNNFDLLYNLAYVYEMLGEYNNSIRAYRKSKFKCTDKNLREQIDEIICSMSIKYKDKIKKRIAFFIRQGLDNFIDDIIIGLSSEYETRKIIVTSYNHIDEGMEWADICWFEWCDELIIYGSEHPLSVEKKIICRLHSYEAFTDYPKKVNWHNVDKLIFVAEHIRDIVLNKVSIDSEKTEVIYNGIDVGKYIFRERAKGFNIAYVGYINFKKGPMLLLHAFKAIYDKDSRYKLYIAGQFQEERYLLYFEQLIKELQLENSVIFEGWQSDINKWLEDKHYILSTSVLEGNPLGVMEGMARGLKPLIHNFVGAKQQFNKYVWNSINECVDMVISPDYNPKEYHQYILQNFSYELQMRKINNILFQLTEGIVITKEDLITNDINVNNIEKDVIEETNVVEYYNNFLGYLEKDRERENPRHAYLKNRLREIIKKGDKVLDLGCGIGITTEYIKSLGVTKVVGVDLSPKLVNYARQTVKDVEFITHDITTFNIDEKFDVISLCDVIEHVPRERYESLFEVIKKHLKSNGVVFMSIPDDKYLDFVRNHRPELLQIIDNSIPYTEIELLCKRVGLKIRFFNSYGIFLPNEYNEYILCTNESYESAWSTLIE